MKFKMLALFLFVLALFHFPLRADSLDGKVIGISDGDTITVLDAGRQQHKIRLNGIDAPESSQPFGQTSKRHLSEQIFGKQVTIEWRKQDRYGRILGKVFLGDKDINLAQLRAGYAWYFRKYASDIEPADRPVYERAEGEARSARRDLWQDPAPQAPWEFRGTAPEEPPLKPRPVPFPAVTNIQRIIGNKRSMIYHRPDCPDYVKVSEGNQVYFATAAEAEKAGFRRAGNCPNEKK